MNPVTESEFLDQIIKSRSSSDTKEHIEKSHIDEDQPILIQCEQDHLSVVIPRDLKATDKVCRVCSGSTGEKKLNKVLRALRFNPVHKAFLNSVPYLNFTCMISHMGRTIYFEFDDERHFKSDSDLDLEVFHHDIIKTIVAIKEGHYVVRIDYTYLDKSNEELAEFIVDTLKHKKHLSLTNHKGYDRLLNPTFVDDMILYQNYRGNDAEILEYFYFQEWKKHSIEEYFSK